MKFFDPVSVYGALYNQIKGYCPIDPLEAQEQAVFLEYMYTFDNLLTRENHFAHLTASGWVINPARDKVLMVYHNIYDSWSWTGGHADGEINLLDVAIREAKEETGITHVRPVLAQDAEAPILSLDILPVWRHMKRAQPIASHLHLNVTYLLQADESDPLVVKEDENMGVRWIPVKQVLQECTEEPMKPMYRKLMQRVERCVD